MGNRLTGSGETQTDLGNPKQDVAEYVAWFNKRYKFATARVVMDKDGKRSVDIDYGKPRA